jgi:hypothetical protein
MPGQVVAGYQLVLSGIGHAFGTISKCDIGIYWPRRSSLNRAPASTCVFHLAPTRSLLQAEDAGEILSDLMANHQRTFETSGRVVIHERHFASRRLGQGASRMNHGNEHIKGSRIRSGIQALHQCHLSTKQTVTLCVSVSGSAIVPVTSLSTCRKARPASMTSREGVPQCSGG